jgi:hypothetical protein
MNYQQGGSNLQMNQLLNTRTPDKKLTTIFVSLSREVQMDSFHYQFTQLLLLKGFLFLFKSEHIDLQFSG